MTTLDNESTLAGVGENDEVAELNPAPVAKKAPVDRWANIGAMDSGSDDDEKKWYKGKKKRVKEVMAHFNDTKVKLDAAEELLFEKERRLKELEAELARTKDDRADGLTPEAATALQNRLRMLEDSLKEKDESLHALESEAAALEELGAGGKKYNSWNGAAGKMMKGASKKNVLAEVEGAVNPNAHKMRDVEGELAAKESELARLQREVEEKDALLLKWAAEAEEATRAREEARQALEAQESLIKSLKAEQATLPSPEIAPLLEMAASKDKLIADLRSEITNIKVTQSELRNLASRQKAYASIVDTRKHTDAKGKPYVQYEVEVTVNGVESRVWKRYSEFHKLEGQLKERVKGVPELEAWRRLWGHLEAEVVEYRRMKIEEWFNRVLAHCVLAQSREVQAFCTAEATSAPQ